MTEGLDILHGSRLPETTRVARLLDLIWRIWVRPHYWTRRRLAEAFEVSERSIATDIEMIRHRLNFELKADRGKGYYFEHIPQMPAVTYSFPEALALLLAAEAGRHTPGIPQQELASAIARLEAILPGDLGRLVRKRTDERSDSPPTHREQMLQTCLQAISGRRRLRMTYSTAYRGGVETTRDVEPYEVFTYDRAWHMVANCLLRGEPRVFKIDRIRSAAILPITFQIPNDFSLTQFLEDDWGLMRGLDLPTEQVELRFSPLSAAWIVDEHWHSSQQLQSQPDGSLVFRVAIGITPEFQRWVFGYGSEVTVAQPDHLRAWVRAEAERVQRLSATGPQ